MDEINFSLKYDIYFFDIFDTLIKRKIDPEYIKKLWCKELKIRAAIALPSEKMYSIRNRKEIELCKKNEAAGMDQEFQYEALIQELYPLYLLQDTFSCEEFYRLAYKIELDTEKMMQSVCEDTKNILRYLKGNHKKIVCISDFYMPKDFLIELLQYHNLNDFIDDIYVSSQYLWTKRSGKLYQKVLEAYDKSSKNFLMTGDNTHSDITMAQKYGFDTNWLDRKQQFQFYQKMEMEHGKNISYKIKELYKDIDRDQYEDITFTLYHYTEKLYYYLVSNQVRHVFFLSREGEFLKKIFDEYQKEKIYKIETHYLLVSRKSTFMASLKSLKEEKFEMIFRQYIHISLYDFLMSLGFFEEEIVSISEVLQADPNYKEDDFPRSEIFHKLKECEKFRIKYEKKRMEQQDNFKAYLLSYGIDFKKEGMYLVDVGWKGTIQDNIFEFFQEEVAITGLYLGLVAAGKKHPSNQKIGLLFQWLEEKSRYFQVYNENKSIFEIILGASHGSADRYENHNGTIEVITAEQEKEKLLFQNTIHPMQDRIFSVFQKIRETFSCWRYDFDELEDFFAEIQANMVYFPTKKQIDLFYHIYHFENFGVFEFTKFKTKKKYSLTSTAHNLLLLCRNRTAFFSTSFWGVIALKDSGLSFLIRLYGKYKYTRCYLDERNLKK